MIDDQQHRLNKETLRASRKKHQIIYEDARPPCRSKVEGCSHDRPEAITFKQYTYFSSTRKITLAYFLEFIYKTHYIFVNQKKTRKILSFLEKSN